MPKPKVKSAKATDDESKKLKGKKSGSSTEELDQTQTKEEQSNMGQSTTETVINSTIEIKEPVVVVEEVAEVKYEEPVLTYIIVERYNPAAICNYIFNSKLLLLKLRRRERKRTVSRSRQGSIQRRQRLRSMITKFICIANTRTDSCSLRASFNLVS